eukprot:scaffold13506_cov65-Skeletonema_dohrnii-CCMP3373.AAC.1
MNEVRASSRNKRRSKSSGRSNNKKADTKAKTPASKENIVKELENTPLQNLIPRVITLPTIVAKKLIDHAKSMRSDRDTINAKTA